MSTTRKARRRTRSSHLTLTRPSLLEIGRLRTLESWAGVTLSVQAPAAHLASGRLRTLAVGAVHPLAPVLYMSEYRPVGDAAGFQPVDGGGDWWCGEAGTVCARGVLVPPVSKEDGRQTFLVDVAGRAFPLNWTNVEPFLSPVIEASGGLYLEPAVEPGALLGPTGDCCRAPLRVVAVRRYTLDGEEPGDPVGLDRTPDPWEVEERASYVVDLVEAG